MEDNTQCQIGRHCGGDGQIASPCSPLEIASLFGMRLGQPF